MESTFFPKAIEAGQAPAPHANGSPHGETAAPASKPRSSQQAAAAPADPFIERVAVMLRKRGATHRRLGRHFYRLADDLRLSHKLIGNG